MNKVWIIEDDAMYAEMLKRQIEKSEGFTAEVFTKAEQAIKESHTNLPKAVFLDYQLPGENGSKVLELLQQKDAELPVIVISGQEDPTVAVDLIKKGAYEYLTKSPETPRTLTSILAKLSKQIRMKSELESLRAELNKRHDFAETMGQSAAMAKQIPLLEKAAKSTIIVSLTGETGVGKETAAKTIHFNSARATGSFVSVQLGSIPADQVEEHLFGKVVNEEYKSGAFAQTAQGTLFLDELAELDAFNQAKLLNALKESKYIPVNGTEEQSLTSRIIVSTNKNLKELVRTGAFREDLYYKVLGLPINIPALKDRRSDILVLARQFANAYCRANGMDLFRFEKEAQEKLLQYNWPGNVRELKAVIELACVLATGDQIIADDISYEDTSASEDILSTERPLREYTAHIIEYFLGKYEGDIPRVADILDIGKSTIYRMIKNNEIKNIK
jgi:two-component system response regulator AtoC